MKPDQIIELPDYAKQALLLVHEQPDVWRHLPGFVRRQLRSQNLVVQNKNDDWELSEIGHKVRKQLTGHAEINHPEPKEPDHYGPTFKTEEQK